MKTLMLLILLSFTHYTVAFNVQSPYFPPKTKVHDLKKIDQVVTWKRDDKHFIYIKGILYTLNLLNYTYPSIDIRLKGVMAKLEKSKTQLVYLQGIIYNLKNVRNKVKTRKRSQSLPIFLKRERSVVVFKHSKPDKEPIKHYFHGNYLYKLVFFGICCSVCALIYSFCSK